MSFHLTVNTVSTTKTKWLMKFSEITSILTFKFDNLVYAIICCLFWESQKTYKYILWKNCRVFFRVKVGGASVTTVFQLVNNTIDIYQPWFLKRNTVSERMVTTYLHNFNLWITETAKIHLLTAVAEHSILRYISKSQKIAQLRHGQGARVAAVPAVMYSKHQEIR